MKKPHKRRVFSAEEKAEFLKQYDALPEGRSGKRAQWLKEKRLGWWLMNRWRHNRAVRAAAMRSGAKLLESPRQAIQRIRISDLPELNLPPKEVGTKRQFTLRQKAEILAQWDALPVSSDDRGDFARKYEITWHTVDRWRRDLERERIPIPNLKLKPEMNGHADILAPPAKRGGVRPGSGRPRGVKHNSKNDEPKESGQFKTAHDVIDWLTIQIEERQNIRKELEQHVGKTRDE